MNRMHRRRGALRSSLVVLCLAAGTLVTGCAPVVVGGTMIGGVMVYADRRTAGTQLEDQNIELKSSSALGPIADRGHISVTSYDRVALITGEVPTEADRVAAEQAIARIENVRGTINELAVMGNSSLTSRSNDAYLVSKIKAAQVDSSDWQANVVKVVVERGDVYLLGRVTQKEADSAVEVARRVEGVHKVIKVFEILTDAELAAIQPK